MRKKAGARSRNPAGRFESTRLEADDDGWGSLDEPAPNPATTLIAEFPKHAITTNRSPDVPFDQSLNPYQGCEHGCIYCFARPAHAYLNLSPGLDFETRIFHKPGLAALLAREISAPRYVCKVLHIGGNTDPYQPAERSLRSTRAVLELLLRAAPPAVHHHQGRADPARPRPAARAGRAAARCGVRQPHQPRRRR